MTSELHGGVELGGTKAIALIARGREILERTVVPTRSPAETLPLLAEWLGERRDQIRSVGIASFGPVRLDPSAEDYGHILKTPKPGWSGAAVVPAFADLGLPVRIDTDVNAAALAEHAWGAGREASSLVYLTIGTGLGAGIVVEGRPIHGWLHPEAGHIRPGEPTDGFAGSCPFHGACAEGLLCGVALAERFGCDPASVPPGDPRWQAPAVDLARFLSSLILLLAPERILIGGSVALGQSALLRAAIARIPHELGGYLPDLNQAALETLIAAPLLGHDAGPLGAIRLAHMAGA